MHARVYHNKFVGRAAKNKRLANLHFYDDQAMRNKWELGYANNSQLSVIENAKKCI